MIKARELRLSGKVILKIEKLDRAKHPSMKKFIETLYETDTDVVHEGNYILIDSKLWFDLMPDELRNGDHDGWADVKYR